MGMGFGTEVILLGMLEISKTPDMLLKSNLGTEFYSMDQTQRSLVWWINLPVKEQKNTDDLLVISHYYEKIHYF